jgi:hypothetical protein
VQGPRAKLEPVPRSSLARQVLAAALAGTIVTALAAESSAGRGPQRIDTKVDAKYDFSTNVVSGDVDAKKGCDEDREAVLLLHDAATGDRTRAGRDRFTDGNGRYSIQSSLVPVPGDQWEIVILLATVQQIYICQKARIRIAA